MAAAAGQMAARASHAAAKVSAWATHFPIKIAGWAARRAAQAAAAWATEDAQSAAYAVTWAAEDKALQERRRKENIRIGKLLHTGLTRDRRGRRGVGSGRQRRRREGKNRRQHRRAQIQRAWTREGWRRAEVRLEQRQAARWQDKGHNKRMATRRLTIPLLPTAWCCRSTYRLGA